MLKTAGLKKYLKIRRKAQKAPVQEFHFNTIASLQPATLLKKRLKSLTQCSECFAMAFSKFCRAANFMSTSSTNYMFCILSPGQVPKFNKMQKMTAIYTLLTNNFMVKTIAAIGKPENLNSNCAKNIFLIIQSVKYNK